MPQIIAALVAMLIGAAREYLPGIIGRLLAAFGIGLFTNKVALPAMKSFVNALLPGLGPIGMAYFEASGTGVAITLILSAIAAALGQKVLLSKLKGS